MKLIKSKVLIDGAEEKENMITGFEGDEIKYVGSTKPDEAINPVFYSNYM